MNSSPENIMDLSSVFGCRNITKCFEGEPVVSGIDLDLPEGSLVSLIGPSGTGKTTLFNVLAGVDNPDEGRIFLGGRDITGISGKVSYMMQEDLLLEYMTVLDNAILPLIIHGEKKKTAREYGASFFPDFGLAGHEKKYPHQLSGGMRQRAALLRSCLQAANTSINFNHGEHGGWNRKSSGASMHSETSVVLENNSNPVVLLDEPFSALDALTRRTMQDWFLGIAEKYRLCAVFITHDVEEAIFLSERVYVLKGTPGKITGSFSIPAAHLRSRDFSLSPEFAALKKSILEAIES